MNSKTWFEKAQALIPGGVNSPVRAYKAVGGVPRFIVSAKGAFVKDVEGRSYLDCMGSWGPMILGHAHSRVVEAVQEAASRGTSFGTCSPLEVELAERVVAAFPSIEKVRFVNSGTEAVMSAVRLARAATERSKILKFAGGYHGHADYLLAQAGSGIATLGIPATPGVPREFTRPTLTAPYNDLASVGRLMEEHGRDIACILVEPVAGNMGVVPPGEDFLDGLRALCDRYGALLILDEVITGFRVAYGGAQERYGVRADLTTLGKIVGGGLPVGAYGGRRDLMDMLAPEGAVYQAGTLSGNPLAMAAGAATLDVLRENSPYERLEHQGKTLQEGFQGAAREAGAPVTINRVGSMFTVFFSAAPVRDYASVQKSDTARFVKFFRAMLKGGIMLPPSPFEACFLSTAHTDADVKHTLRVAKQAFAEAAGAS
jgi:glutamate-1-semialdehyde 2,1-aminomutase